LPYSVPVSTDKLNDLKEALLAGLRAIPNPLERAKRSQGLVDELPDAISRIRFEAMTEVGASMTHAELGQALGLTRARVSQILKAGPPPERSLLAPDAGEPVTFAVVEKRDSETGQPVTASTTKAALRKLEELAATLGVETDEEQIPPPGLLDLNRNNLAVLIGPRISSLIAQVVASDPVIQWRRDSRNHWYLVDSRTGAEFHSDFDNGWTPTAEGERQCIAHIGRIRRPDSQGAFLYLGGAHAAGTAGAVDAFVRDYTSIWEQAKRALWSAVVVTKATEKGVPISAELATPIYVHGKR
jgi:hypothetical protein